MHRASSAVVHGEGRVEEARPFGCKQLGIIGAALVPEPELVDEMGERDRPGQAPGHVGEAEILHHEGLQTEFQPPARRDEWQGAPKVGEVTEDFGEDRTVGRQFQEGVGSQHAAIGSALGRDQIGAGDIERAEGEHVGIGPDAEAGLLDQQPVQIGKEGRAAIAPVDEAGPVRGQLPGVDGADAGRQLIGLIGVQEHPVAALGEGGEAELFQRSQTGAGPEAVNVGTRHVVAGLLNGADDATRPPPRKAAMDRVAERPAGAVDI